MCPEYSQVLQYSKNGFTAMQLLLAVNNHYKQSLQIKFLNCTMQHRRDARYCGQLTPFASSLIRNTCPLHTYRNGSVIMEKIVIPTAVPY